MAFKFNLNVGCPVTHVLHNASVFRRNMSKYKHVSKEIRRLRWMTVLLTLKNLYTKQIIQPFSEYIYKGHKRNVNE